ncbi:MAG: SusC/RagA family TonB-linked outer membrane protein [Bacteroidota bacterium]|nr:SusC/RagA family TonB-linked outer membrane protein [Bacteroidota bacterium]
MKKRIYSLSLLLLIAATGISAFAQNSPAQPLSKTLTETVTTKLVLVEYNGVVIDEATGKGIQGAIIHATGANRYSSMTKEDGSFSIKVPDYIGQITCQVPGYNEVQTHLAKVNEKIRIRMFPENFKTDYTEQTNITNSNSTDHFSTISVLTIDEKIATDLGADIRSLQRSANPAQGSALFIGGFNSLNANSQPLFVVDGVIWDSQNNRSLMHDGYFNNVLSAISVNDIEKVTVVKNATALYGSKGSNGVILIDTKRFKSMATRIDVTLSAGVETMPHLPSMMNASQYRSYVTDLIGNTNTSADFLNDFTKDKQKYATYHNNTDWTDYTYRNALTQNYGLNVQGGDEIAGYNLSFGYVKAQSMLVSNDFSRINLRFNTDVNITRNITSMLNVAYSSTTRDLRDDGAPSDYSSSTVLAPGFLSFIKAPILNPYQYDAEGALTPTLADNDRYFGLANPVSIQKNGEASNKNNLKYNLFSLNIIPKWQITSSMFMSEQFSYMLNNVTERYFLPDEGVPAFLVDGYDAILNESKVMSSMQTSLYSDARFGWDKTFSANKLTILGGFRYMRDVYQQDGIEVNNTASDKMPDIASTYDNRKVQGVNEGWASTSLYMNADYNYAEKYFLQGTVTTETSTRFGKNATGGIKLSNYIWAFFPSIQGSWVVSAEPFFRNIKGIDYLKLNAGFDQSGNDDIDCFASRTYFSSESFLNQTAGLSLANIGNDKLKWETTSRATAGIEMNLLGNRIGVTANIFQSHTNDLLTYKTLSGISGLNTYLCNEGSLKNTGYDVSARAKMLNSKNFQWELGASVGHYKNEITSLPEVSYTTNLYGAEVLTKVGQPAGVFYGYQTKGIFTTTEEAVAANLKNGSEQGTSFRAGDVRFVDQNSDNVIDESDKVVIGDPNPALYGNLFNRLNFKNITLNVVFNYSLGNDIYNYQRSQLEAGSNYFNQTTALLNRWTYEGQQTSIPRTSYGDHMGNSRFSDRWIEDGSFLRMKSLTLSYLIPITNTYLRGITVWGTANNLWTLTDYLGNDPEVSMSNKTLFQGIDRGLLSSGRSFILGVNINL